MVVGHAARAIFRIAKGFFLRSKGKDSVAPGAGPVSTMTTTGHRARIGDCDFFMHMNNAMYLRHAELARWELLPRTGILQAALKHRWMFLVVSQQAEYLKPLPPLSSFSIETTSYADKADKYLLFKHDFISDKDGSVFCTASVKGIGKHTRAGLAGKTVRPSEMIRMTDGLFALREGGEENTAG